MLVCDYVIIDLKWALCFVSSLRFWLYVFLGDVSLIKYSVDDPYADQTYACALRKHAYSNI